MTLKELNEFVAASPNKEWLQNYEMVIGNKSIKHLGTIKSIVAIYEFVTNQAEGFSKYEQLPNELNQLKVKFIGTKGNILNLLTNNNFQNNVWNDNLAWITGNRHYIFLHDSPETEFLIKVQNEHPDYYPGAYQYLTGTITNNPSRDLLAGYFMAYEFYSKDFSLIVERKDSEKKSILSIRSDFQKKLGEAESEVVEFFSKSNQKFDEYAKKIDTIKSEKNESFDVWFKKVSGDFNTFNSEASQKIKDFEDLYKAKLKLEAPAKYWNDRAVKLRKEGYWWLGGLILSILISAGILVWVLDEISKGVLSQIFQNTGTSIKWSVALITIISFLAFFIRTFSKLTFSSFHLVRDAEEREQLTYVYLALQKEKGIDQTERHLIMQSLFSRADTGLLKDEGSPTMPGNITDQMIRKP